MAGGVIVAHPGTQYSYETALAVQNAGLLRQYVTGVYYKSTHPLARGLQLLPSRTRSAVERELFRRYKEGLDTQRITTFPIVELIHILVARLKPLRRVTPVLLRWRNERFDAVVGRLIDRERPAALICYNSSALQAFKRAQPLGIVCLLDQSIAHIRTGFQLLREEAQLHPDFADSLQIEVPDQLIERCTEEALMADGVLAASDYVKKSLIDNGVDPTRIMLLPYGADIARFCPKARSQDAVFRLLFVGQLSQRKGIKYLLEAVKQLHLPKSELLLVGGEVGSGSGLATYRDYFTAIPPVPHHEIHTYFQQADVFVYPSLYEGSAIVIYEALASGLPVITTPNSGSVVRDGVEGFIVPIRDVEGLIEKILMLYENPELRQEMSHNARKRAQEFTWQNYYQRLGTLLHRTLEKREEREEREEPKEGRTWRS